MLILISIQLVSVLSNYGLSCENILTTHYDNVLQITTKRVMANGSFSGGDFALDYVILSPCPVITTTPAPIRKYEI